MFCFFFPAKISIDPDLSDALLSGLDLSSVDFRKAYLRGAELSQAKLTNAKLSDADLVFAVAREPLNKHRVRANSG